MSIVTKTLVCGRITIEPSYNKEVRPYRKVHLSDWPSDSYPHVSIEIYGNTSELEEFEVGQEYEVTISKKA